MIRRMGLLAERPTSSRRPSAADRLAVRLERLPELDASSPLDVAELVRDRLPGLVLLESARPGRNARWSYVGADPVGIVGPTRPGGEPFAEARAVLARLAAGRRAWTTPDTDGPAAELPPLSGGLVGHLSYDLGRRLERLPSVAVDDQPIPDLRLQLHDWVLAHDRRTGRWWLGGRALDGDAGRLAARLSDVRDAVLGSRPVAPRDLPAADHARRRGAAVDGLVFRSGLSRPEYEARVEAIRGAIARGDVYQANLARRLEAPFEGDPWRLYRRLRTGDPALFAAFLPLDGAGPPGAGSDRQAIISASPEPFLTLSADGRVAADPIKGTRPRGQDRVAERRLARELLTSAKDRAENVMIVDVLRNDLGRVCRPGSVRVPRCCRLERTTAVQHLVSTVTGRLSPGRDAFDLLAASFPGGSISGAPKIRAMELLESLEPVRRGPYTGAAGWIGADGAMQLSILIRTFVADGRRLTLHVGGGITWRSEPAAEWTETVAKARGPLAAIGAAEADW
jgi:para-aminobenzoate synthetase component I